MRELTNSKKEKLQKLIAAFCEGESMDDFIERVLISPTYYLGQDEDQRLAAKQVAIEFFREELYLGLGRLVDEFEELGLTNMDEILFVNLANPESRICVEELEQEIDQSLDVFAQDRMAREVYEQEIGRVVSNEEWEDEVYRRTIAIMDKNRERRRILFDADITLIRSEVTAQNYKAVFVVSPIAVAYLEDYISQELPEVLVVSYSIGQGSDDGELFFSIRRGGEVI